VFVDQRVCYETMNGDLHDSEYAFKNEQDPDCAGSISVYEAQKANAKILEENGFDPRFNMVSGYVDLAEGGHAVFGYSPAAAVEKVNEIIVQFEKAVRDNRS
jgi:hypothetical protein